MQVAFYKGRSRIFNRLVSWFCKGVYSHVELVMCESPHGHVCASSSFLDGGVRIKVIKLKTEHWDIVDVGGDPVAAHEWLDQHLGDGYDIRGLIGFIWRPAYQSRKRWYCNEAVGAMLGEVDPWRFDPCSYAASKGLQP